MPAYPVIVRRKWYFLTDKVGWSISRISKEYRISRKTFYKWRNKDLGKRFYQPRQRQPKTKLSFEIKIFIEREKKSTNAGPKKLKLMIERRFSLRVSTTIIYRYLKRRNLILRPQKKLPWYEPLKEPIIPKKPGELLQIDIKYVWTPRGRKYQRTFLDVFTGLQFAHLSDIKDDETTIAAFKEAERYFPFPILGAQTDNGGEFRGDFHKFLGEKGVSHYFIPKRSPQWNGAVERAHRSIDEEFYRNLSKPWSTLEQYLNWYNTKRIHLGKYLNGLTPMEKLLQWKESVTSRC